MSLATDTMTGHMGAMQTSVHGMAQEMSQIRLTVAAMRTDSQARTCGNQEQERICEATS